MTTAEQSAAAERFMRVADRLPTMYALSEEFARLVDLFEDPDADEDEINSELDRLTGDIETKAHGIAVVAQALKRRHEMLKAERQRIAAREKAAENAYERLKARTYEALKLLRTDRIDTGTFTLSIALNNPSVDVLDENAIPPDYWRIPAPEVDKVAILEHWRATGGKSITGGVSGGEVPPGVAIKRNESLRIS